MHACPVPHSRLHSELTLVTAMQVVLTETITLEGEGERVIEPEDEDEPEDGETEGAQAPAIPEKIAWRLDHDVIKRKDFEVVSCKLILSEPEGTEYLRVHWKGDPRSAFISERAKQYYSTITIELYYDPHANVSDYTIAHEDTSTARDLPLFKWAPSGSLLHLTKVEFWLGDDNVFDLACLEMDQLPDIKHKVEIWEKNILEKIAAEALPKEPQGSGGAFESKQSQPDQGKPASAQTSSAPLPIEVDDLSQGGSVQLVVAGGSTGPSASSPSLAPLAQDVAEPKETPSSRRTTSIAPHDQRPGTTRAKVPTQ